MTKSGDWLKSIAPPPVRRTYFAIGDQVRGPWRAGLSRSNPKKGRLTWSLQRRRPLANWRHRFLALPGCLKNTTLTIAVGENTQSEAACKERGIALQALADELEQCRPHRKPRRMNIDWNRASLRDLIGHILLRHHAYLRSELPRIAELFAKVISAHSGREPALFQVQTRSTRLARRSSQSPMTTGGGQIPPLAVAATITCRTPGQARAASVATCSMEALPRRKLMSAVIRTFARESSSRVATAGAEARRRSAQQSRRSRRTPKKRSPLPGSRQEQSDGIAPADPQPFERVREPAGLACSSA